MTENGDALDDCNVFVKYLPPDISDQELHDLFLEYGKIKSAKVMYDPQTGNSLGYGYLSIFLTIIHSVLNQQSTFSNCLFFFLQNFNFRLKLCTF